MARKKKEDVEKKEVEVKKDVKTKFGTEVVDEKFKVPEGRK